MAKENDTSKWEEMAEQENHQEQEATESESASDKDAQTSASDEIAGILEHPSYMALQEQLTEAEQKMMRLAAELENTRRRSEKELSNAHKYSIEKLAKELIPVVDSLEHALDASNDGNNETMREGIDLTLKMFLSALEKFSIKPVNPINEKFDPSLHEAMSTQESADVEPNTVTAVIQKGYQLHDRVVRPAMVIVSKPPAS